MRKEIYSAIIGKLVQDESFPDWWRSSLIDIPLLGNRRLVITFMDVDPGTDKKFIEEADQALTNFLAMTINDRNSISEFAYANCIDFLDAVDFEEEEERPFREITDKNDIWNFITPTEIYLSRWHRRDMDMYVQVACNCDWEQEHGLQFVFRQGRRLTRISDQDGHLTEADAYNKPDEEDKLLSSFQ